MKLIKNEILRNFLIQLGSWYGDGSFYINFAFSRERKLIENAPIVIT